MQSTKPHDGLKKKTDKKSQAKLTLSILHGLYKRFIVIKKNPQTEV